MLCDLLGNCQRVSEVPLSKNIKENTMNIARLFCYTKMHSNLQISLNHSSNVARVCFNRESILNINEV